MKKTTVVGIALLIAVFSASPAEREPMDLVVAVDTSAGLYSSFAQVSDYLAGPLLWEYLKPGDTFHLIGFSDTARLEISRRVDGPEDIETIISRLLITYPLDPHTDLIAALDGIYGYLRSLPKSRMKTVLLVSDGDQSPPPGSPNAGLSSQEASKRISAGGDRIKSAGWNFRFIQVPLSAALVARKAPAPSAAKVEPSEVRKTGETIGTKESSAGEPRAAGQAGPGLSRPGAAAPEAAQATTQDAVAPQAAARNEPRSASSAAEAPGAAPATVSAPPAADAAPAAPAGAVAAGTAGAASTSELSAMTPEPSSESPAPKAEAPVVPREATEIRPSAEPEAGPPFAALLSQRISASAPYLFAALAVLAAAAVLLLIAFYLKRSFSAPNRVAARAAKSAKQSGSAAKSNIRRGGSDSPAVLPAAAKEPAASAAAVSTRTAATSQAAGRPAAPAAPLVRAADAPTQQRSLSTQLSVSARPGASASAEEAAGALQQRKGLLLKAAPTKEPKRKDELLPVQREYVVRKADARIMLSLWVRDQNRSIGKRNVHLMKAGTTLSLGGGRSDFLIFLVSVPARIADVHFDGVTCSLSPRRPGYFPDTGSSPIEDCLEKTVRIVSDKGFELFMKLERFEDPLVKLNSFLHSIDAEGVKNA